METMLSSLVIRHGKSSENWESLDYDELLELISLKSEPGLEPSFLEHNIEIKKLNQLKVDLIYTSPLKRARETAKFISEALNLDIRIVEGLKEIKFDSLPYEIYEMGPQAIRQYLVNETKNAKITVDEKLFANNSLIITHGFLMRKIFVELGFSNDLVQLVNDDRFTKYLSGFNYKTGEQITLSK